MAHDDRSTNGGNDSTPVTGAVRSQLRGEGLLLAAAAVVLYARLDGGWGRFAALFLVPDLSFLFYLVGPRAGALAYNTLHSEIGPLALGAVAALGVGPAWLLPLACIWAAHVGFDRALGYGLKYASAFRHTHLGVIGRAPAAVSAEPLRAS